MLRSLFCAGLLLAALFTLLESTGRGQPASTADRIYYRDKKDGQIKEVDGELKAAPGGLQVVAASDKKIVATVSAVDVVRVIPADIPGYDLKTIREPATVEAKKDWEKARLIHVEMAKKSAAAPEKVRKYLEFRIAYTTARAADETADETAAQAKGAEAIKLLDSFLTGNKTGWEVWAAGSTCARLQVSETTASKDGEKSTERRNFEESARTWGKVAKAADLAADLKVEAAIQEIDAKIRARQLADAKGLIDEAMKTAPEGSSAKGRLGVLALAVKFGDNPNPEEGVKAIEAELAKTKDPAIRATGFGMMGELYLAKDKPREAMWQFVWVEVVYNQDRDEVIKTLARLADAFKLQGEDDRAKSYREKLRRYRSTL